MTEAKPYRHVDRIAELDEAARAMLAALKSFVSVFGGDAGLDAAMRVGLDAELIEARAAIAQAEAAGIRRFAKTFCSQCGGEFGPGDSGYSHCRDHKAGAEP